MCTLFFHYKTVKLFGSVVCKHGRFNCHQMTQTLKRVPTHKPMPQTMTQKTRPKNC